MNYVSLSIKSKNDSKADLRQYSIPQFYSKY